MVPLCSPLRQYQEHSEEILKAMHAVLNKGQYILGENVEAFEKEFAAFCEVKDAVGVGNGTDAIQLALMACGVKPGDEVITVSHTANATVSAVVAVGGTPVLVDIEPKYYTLDPLQLSKALSGKTKAVIAVHIYGQTVDLTAIQTFCHERGIPLIEDCAQAHGARYQGKRVGSFGDLATFSFYPTKNLGAIGDGGMVLGKDSTLVHKVRLLRQYGWETRYVSQSHGVNSRLDEVQAAILRVKLKDLDEDNQKRRYHASNYSEALLGVKGIHVPEVRSQTEPVHHLYVVQVDDRKSLMDKLTRLGVGYGIHYPLPIHLHPGYQPLLRCVGDLPVTTALANRILSLPMFPELTDSERQKVVEAIRA